MIEKYLCLFKRDRDLPNIVSPAKYRFNSRWQYIKWLWKKLDDYYIMVSDNGEMFNPYMEKEYRNEKYLKEWLDLRNNRYE